MTIKLFLSCLLFSLFACNANDNGKPAGNDSTTTVTPANNDSQKAALNVQSKECIRLMNVYEDQKATAVSAGDMQKAAALQSGIDSAAMANAKIGQQLMELDK